MLSLNSPRWSELRHAYGAASDTPGLLAGLDTLPQSQGEAEPWFTLWSSLAHQGDVFSASFAAVPHVIEALSRDPLRADSAYFQFPAWVEVCRKRQKVKVPDDLEASYFASLSRLPGLIAAASGIPISYSVRWQRLLLRKGMNFWRRRPLNLAPMWPENFWNGSMNAKPNNFVNRTLASLRAAAAGYAAL